MLVVEKGTANIPVLSKYVITILLLCRFFCADCLWARGLSLNDVEPRITVRIFTKRIRFHPAEDISVRVEVWNESDQNLFICKDIDNRFSNALAKIDLTLYRGSQAVGPSLTAAADSFSSERLTYPPLAAELPRYWIALPPQHFYGGEVVMRASSFEKPKAPGRYRIQGKYSSRGFLAQDINNPLLHYAQELKRLPYQAWVGTVETNSIWIEVYKVK